MSSQLRILDCRLDLVDAHEASDRILGYARAGTSAQIVTLGTEMVVAAQRDSGFRAIINASALNVCDTVGLLAVARLRGATLRERVTGVELIELLAAQAAREKIGVFFLGGAPGVAEEAARALRSRYSELDVLGTADGYFASDDEEMLMERIRSSGARLLLLGLGSPRQEVWFSRHAAALPGMVGIGVGGSFDVLSGRVARAPQGWRALHLEWLYRLLKEPSRWRRQLALLYFVWLALGELLLGRSSRKDQ